MGIRTRLALSLATVFSLLMVGAPAVSASGADIDYTYRYLRPADATNGPVKYKFVSGSFQDMCSATWDISVLIYYDFLDANRIHITKATVKYYIKRWTVRVGGGVGSIARNDLPFWESPTQLTNDLWTMYHFKPENEDFEHYALSGTVTTNLNLWLGNVGFTVDKYTYGNGGWNEDCLGLTIGEFNWTGWGGAGGGY